MAFVDIRPANPVAGSSGVVAVESSPELVEARRTRRQELARGWRFACECPRCVAEGLIIASQPIKTTTAPAEEGDAEDTKDAIEDQTDGQTIAPAEVAEANGTTATEKAEEIKEEAVEPEPKVDDDGLEDLIEEPKIEDAVRKFEERSTEDVPAAVSQTETH
jgi:import receptor subunit TOM20